MENDLKQEILTRLDWVFRLVLAGLFLYAAYPKITEPLAFAKAITNYRVIMPVVGQGYVYLAAGFIPALEAVTAAGLIFTRTRRASSLLIAGMLVVFTVLILQAVLRGLNIDCGCFGSSEVAQAKANKVGWLKIAENFGMLAMAVFVYVRSAPRRGRYRE